MEVVDEYVVETVDGYVIEVECEDLIVDIVWVAEIVPDVATALFVVNNKGVAIEVFTGVDVFVGEIE